MRYRKMMFMLVLVIFIFGAASVCAGDVDDTVIASDDTSQSGLSAGSELDVDNLKTSEENAELTLNDNDDTLSVKNDTEKLGDSAGTYSGLATEIGSGGNIVLQHDYYTYDSGNTIFISIADSVIDGNGAVIDMDGSEIRAFDVSASGVIIKNLTIKNVYYNGDLGGAIYFNQPGAVTNCNFTKNSAFLEGGAVYFKSTGNVTNCNFENNTARNEIAHGGAISINSGTVSNCSFTHNEAGYGAVWMGSGTVSNCIFDNNIVKKDGGAVFINGYGTVTTSRFVYNYATGDLGWGGAIRISSGRVENCSFVENYATYQGGAVCFDGNGKVINCIFTDNDVTYQGGSLWMGSGSAENCNFTDNTAAQYGSAVYFKNGEARNCNFINNSATKEGGAVYFNDEGKVINCNFTNNAASQNGGAAYFKSTGTVTDCIFTDSSATENGGAVWISSSTVSNCNFTHNTANDGGAVHMGSGTVSNCNFTCSTATGNGGAVHVGSGNVLNCNIVNNTATADGGAVYFTGTGEVTNCNLTDNTAANGGAIVFKGGTGKHNVINCTFTDNTAVNGGAVYSYTGGEVTNCNFARNKATGDDEEGEGGAVYFEAYGTVTNCNFTDNTGVKCGAVYFYNGGKVTNSKFTNNSATNGGGAIDINGNSEATVTNCNFTDNTGLYGGAVYIWNSGSVTDCNFVNNRAGDGGAVQMGSGAVSNCNFTDNSATADGGAVYLDDGAVTNCNFNGNSASNDGGALYFKRLTGTVAICSFDGNSASRWGVIFCEETLGVTVDTCIFKTDSDTTVNTRIRPPVLKVDNFTTPYGSNKKLTLDLKTNSSIPVTNGNISISVYSKDNNRWVGNYSRLSGEGWIPDLPVGYYYAIFNTEYAEFKPINRTITVVSDNTFLALNYTINGNDNSVIELSHDFYFDPDCDAAFKNGVEINRLVTIKGNGFVIDAKGQAGIFTITSDNVVIENLTLKNAHAGYGGAVSFFRDGKVINCNFVNNSANSQGGAVYFFKNGELTNCTFADNTARDGGAVFFEDNGKVINCHFTGNNATTGSAIYFWDTITTSTVSNSIFLNNRANAETLDVVKNDNNITITFTGQNNLLNAIYSRNDAAVTLTNVTYWGANGINNTGSFAIQPSRSNRQAGQNIAVAVVVNDEIVLNEVKVTDENGMIVLDISAGENYYISVCHDTDSYYTGAVRTITNNTKFNVNVTSQTTTNRTVNITAKSNIPNDVVKGELLFILPNGAKIEATYGANGTWWVIHTFDVCGDYNVSATYVGLDNVAVTNATISISKTQTEITVENATLELIVRDSVGTGATLTPAGAGNLTFTSSNASVVKVEDGKIIAVGEGSAVITVSFAGNVDYEAAENKTITVNVNKVSTEISVLNDTIVLKVRDEIATGATLTPADAGNLTYTVSNSSVVKVEDGKIIAVGEGSAVITVSFAGDDKYAAAESKTISVTFSKVPTEITVENATVELSVDGSVGIGATLTPADAGDLTYTVRNSSVVKVEDGKIIAVGEGSAVITVSFAGDDKYAAAESKTIDVTVSKVPTEITVENATVELSVGGSIGTGATLTPADAGILEFSSSNITVVKVEDGKIMAVGRGSAVITVSFAGDDKYAAAENKTITVNVNKYGSKVTISPIEDVVYPNNVTIKYGIENRTNVTVSIDGVSDDKIIITNDTITVIGLNAGEYTITILNNENSTHSKSSDAKNFIVNKQKTSIVASGVTATYNKNKVIVITLKDSKGKALANAKVTVVLKGTKTYTTDKNGQIKVSTKGLVPKKYTAKITFNGNGNYVKSTKSIKVTVKKAKPKITAKKKTFKKSKKVKKYTIKLKNNLGKTIKKAKVYIKIGKKTFKAKTNSKGKATFKIKKLTKKGKYKAKITYKGNKYYKKVTKKVKIKIK